MPSCNSCGRFLSPTKSHTCPPKQAIRRYPIRHDRPYSVELYERAMLLLKQGLSAYQVGKALGIRYCAVRKWSDGSYPYAHPLSSHAQRQFTEAEKQYIRSSYRSDIGLIAIQKALQTNGRVLRRFLNNDGIVIRSPWALNRRCLQCGRLISRHGSHQCPLHASMKGRKQSEEHRRKSSDTKRRLYEQGILKAWNRGLPAEQQPFFGKHHTEEHKKRISQWSAGRTIPKEQKEYMSRCMTEHWKNPEYRSRCLEKMLKGLFKRPTLLEAIVLAVIGKHRLPFVYTGDGRVVINGKAPDFVATDGRLLIIEVANMYHHNLDSYQQERQKLFGKLGFRVMVIWEDELYIDKEMSHLRSDYETFVAGRIRSFISDPVTWSDINCAERRERVMGTDRSFIIQGKHMFKQVATCETV